MAIIENLKNCLGYILAYMTVADLGLVAWDSKEHFILRGRRAAKLKKM